METKRIFDYTREQLEAAYQRISREQTHRIEAESEALLLGSRTFLDPVMEAVSHYENREVSLGETLTVILRTGIETGLNVAEVKQEQERADEQDPSAQEHDVPAGHFLAEAVTQK